MKYDFTSIVDRRGKDCTAVDGVGKIPGFTPAAPKEGYDFIPMWIADMNFATCPAIPEAMIKRAQHPLFGYFPVADAYYDAIKNWQEKRHGVIGLEREHIGYENGVHGCVTSAVETLSEPGDTILLHSPTYIGFRQDVEGIGRGAAYSPLKLDENGVWRMDYEDMEAKIRKKKIHLAIFCSPHNPAGRVWERWELEKAMEIFERNEVYVISDEIWADITYAGHRHIPTQMVSEWAKEHTVAIYAPSKTFNLAGLIGSYHIIYNKYLKDRVSSHGNRTHYNEMNVFSQHALIAAYGAEGQEWTDELLLTLEGNAKYAHGFIREHFKGVTAAMPEGTYMMFLDCTDHCKTTGKTLDDILKAGWDVGVGWQDGRAFNGPCHIRMNLASPLSRIQEAFNRLDKYVFNA